MKFARQLLDCHAVHVPVERRREARACDQSGACDREIHVAEDVGARQPARELLQLVQLACQIAASDQRADRSSGDHRDRDIRFVEGAHHADMCPALGGAAAQRQRNAAGLVHAVPHHRSFRLLRGRYGYGRADGKFSHARRLGGVFGRNGLSCNQTQNAQHGRPALAGIRAGKHPIGILRPKPSRKLYNAFYD